MRLIKDLGMLYPNETSKRKKRYGLYECPDCLKETKASMGNVKNGRTERCKDCGTLHMTLTQTGNTYKRTHGETGTRLYRIWKNMKSRCYNNNVEAYKNYGAKGVTVTNEWLHNYEAFRDWSLVNGYEDHLHLDKDELCEVKNIKPKIYGPDTCQWITQEANNGL